MNNKPLIILAVLVVLFVGALALVPSHYVVERSERIDAPVAVVFDALEDLHRWGEWSKLDVVDPALKKTFEGAAKGKGAKMHWVGNEAAGEGEVTIVESTGPEHLAWDVSWTRPEATQARVQVDLLKRRAVTPEEAATINSANLARDAGLDLVEPSPDGTLVTMKVDGQNGFGAKVFALVIDRKRFVGTNLEAELQALKFSTQAEASKIKPPEVPAPPAADAGTVDAGTP